MNWLRSMIIAFSTYSRIPMPQVEWDEKNMKFSMAFLPFIGVVIGLLEYGWQQLANALDLNSMLFAAVATAIPVLVSGGIHLDGLCDTADALSSHQSRERKLEILKDAHIGAFGVILCVLYLLLFAGCMAQLQHSAWFAVTCVAFVLSRAVSALVIQFIPNARGNGMLNAFTGKGNGQIVQLLLCIWVGLAVMLMCSMHPVAGLFAMAGMLLSLAWFLRMIHREFQGITGDLIGCYLQLCELAVCMAVIVGEQIWNFM